jgi:hypothetical protein
MHSRLARVERISAEANMVISLSIRRRARTARYAVESRYAGVEALVNGAVIAGFGAALVLAGLESVEAVPAPRIVAAHARSPELTCASLPHVVDVRGATL